MRSFKQQQQQIILLVLIQGFILVILNHNKTNSEFVGQQTKTNCSNQSNLVVCWCQNGLDFTSLQDYRSFIEQFKVKTHEQLRQDKVATGCLKYRDAILELESLIQTQDVCDPNKIDALIDYHLENFKSSSIFASSRSKPIMHKFFAKYAIQVAYICKKNLIKNLELSREELGARSKVFEEAREKIYNDEPSIKSNIKLIMEQPDEPMATNVKPKDDAEMTLNEYRDALTKLKRPEDILTFDRRQCERSSSRRVNISKEKVQTFFKPAMMCLQLARYYSGNILSIAKLANAGYVAVDDELDVRLADDPMVRNWIIAAQVCEPMLYMRTERVEGDWAIIDTCSERVVSIESMAFEDNFDELDNEMLIEMLPKSEATRNNAQAIMKSVIKKMAKKNLMKELKSGKIKKRSIFSKSLNMLGGPLGPSGSSSIMQMNTASTSCRLSNGAIDVSLLNEQSTGQSFDEGSFEELMKVLSDKTELSNSDHATSDDSSEGAVSMFDPLTSLASTLTVLAVMLTFEWLFFIVMTLAARICHQLSFNFDNILTFPPKVLSWSDADFTQYNDNLEKIDEDDFFDYDELNPDEQRQRDLLAKVFGKPPPRL